MSALELTRSYRTAGRPWGLATIAPTRIKAHGFDLDSSEEITVVLPQVWHFDADGEPRHWNMGRGGPRHNDLRVGDVVVLVALRANHNPETGPWIRAFAPHLSSVFCTHIVQDESADYVAVVEASEPDWSNPASLHGEPLTLMPPALIERALRGYERTKSQASGILLKFLNEEVE